MLSRNLAKSFIKLSQRKAVPSFMPLMRFVETVVPEGTPNATNEVQSVKLGSRIMGTYVRGIDSKYLQIYINAPYAQELPPQRLNRAGNYSIYVCDSVEKQMDRKSGISIPMAPIDMSYIAHLIKEKTTDTFISTEMVSSYDHVKKEKGEKHERKIECKVTDNKDKRVEITLSSEGKTQSVTLNDKEAYFLSEFIKFTVPRVTGWETITRFSPPPARRNNNRMNTYNNNNNNAGNEQQQQQHSNYRNNNYNNNNNQGGRYNNNNAGNNRNNGGYRRNNNNRSNYGGNNIDDLDSMSSLGVDQPDANLADYLVKK